MVHEGIPPWDGGIYVLILRLREDTYVERFHRVFRSGHYAYVGSAQRNLAARIRRHMWKGKKRHWHIDELTEVAEVVTVFSSPLPREYEDMVARCMAGRHESIPGFGATDSEERSHLFFGTEAIMESARRCLEEMESP